MNLLLCIGRSTNNIKKSFLRKLKDEDFFMYSFVIVMCHVWVVSYVMCGLCHVSCATCHMSCVTCQLSVKPTAKATAIYLLPANCPTMCTVGWFAKTKNTPKTSKTPKLSKISRKKKQFSS